MENDIINKIKEYCIKGGMNRDSLKVNTYKDEYVATDGLTSIMFNKNGHPSSLPMHKLYGDKVASIAGAGYGVYTIMLIIITFIVIISTMFGK